MIATAARPGAADECRARDRDHDEARPQPSERPPGQATVTVPFMFGWTSQWKTYLPAGGESKW